MIDRSSIRLCLSVLLVGSLQPSGPSWCGGLAHMETPNADSRQSARLRPPSNPSPGQEWRAGTGLIFVWIPPGSFDMGSKLGEQRCADELPQRRVHFASGFWMGKYEVTQAQWLSVMEDNQSFWRGADLPVERVSWDDAKGFVRRLSERTGAIYRLPSEAEWEYACRAGSTTAYYWGKEMNGAYCWWAWNSSNRTHPVGKTKPNRWGLYDMLGNVHEWCEDAWHTSYNGAPIDGSAWITGGDPGIRVIRGGCWRSDELYLRSAERFGGGKEVGDYQDGFRCVLAPERSQK